MLQYFCVFQEGKIAGRALLIAGHPGTGKTAIAMGWYSIVFVQYKTAWSFPAHVCGGNLI